MKVIFLEDIPNVAKAGQAKEVADGYGRNFLLPRKLAVLASSTAAKYVEAQIRANARRQAETEVEMAELAKLLDGKDITIKAKAGEQERLYGSVTTTDIAAGLEKAGLVVDKRKIELDKAIHQLGSYEITIRLTRDLTPKIKLMVVAEETT